MCYTPKFKLGFYEYNYIFQQYNGSKFTNSTACVLLAPPGILYAYTIVTEE